MPIVPTARRSGNLDRHNVAPWALQERIDLVGSIGPPADGTGSGGTRWPTHPGAGPRRTSQSDDLQQRRHQRRLDQVTLGRPSQAGRMVVRLGKDLLGEMQHLEHGVVADGGETIDRRCVVRVLCDTTTPPNSDPSSSSPRPGHASTGCAIASATTSNTASSSHRSPGGGRSSPGTRSGTAHEIIPARSSRPCWCTWSGCRALVGRPTLGGGGELGHAGVERDGWLVAEQLGGPIDGGRDVAHVAQAVAAHHLGL